MTILENIESRLLESAVRRQGPAELVDTLASALDSLQQSFLRLDGIQRNLQSHPEFAKDHTKDIRRVLASINEHIENVEDALDAVEQSKG